MKRSPSPVQGLLCFLIGLMEVVTIRNAWQQFIHTQLPGFCRSAEVTPQHNLALITRCHGESGIPELLYPHTKFPSECCTPIHDSLVNPVQGYNFVKCNDNA